MTKEPDYLELTLVVCNTCEFRCDYCCILDSLGDKKANVDDGISFLKWQLDMPKNIHKKVVIEFFGGEPLMNFSYIQDIISYIKNHYDDRDISFRLFTNGLNGPLDLPNEYTWSNINEIIVSLDGEYIDNLDRTRSKKAYDKIIKNIEYYRDNNYPFGVAFIVHPDTELERVFNYFKDLGIIYYTFEIASLWNDDKDNGVNKEFLFNTFKFIYENIYLYNVENDFVNPRVVSMPKEFLASYSYSGYSCFDTNRALSLNGNVYSCRDLATGEEQWLKRQNANSKVFFRSSDYIPFNIKDLQLDKAKDMYTATAKEYDSVSPCWIKAFEFKHFARIEPDWYTDEEFQTLIVKPMYELLWLTLSVYDRDKEKDKKYFEHYSQFVKGYGQVLKEYERYVRS